jgi:hypothetical protein
MKRLKNYIREFINNKTKIALKVENLHLFVGFFIIPNIRSKKLISV